MAVLTAACAVALVATSPREGDEVAPPAARELATVPIRPWELDRVVEIKQVLTAGGSELAGRVRLEVRVLGGTVDDAAEEPLPAIPLSGVPVDGDGHGLGAPSSDHDFVSLSRPPSCRGGRCVQRFRLRVGRPEEFPAHLGMEVRLSLSARVDGEDDASVPVDAQLDLFTSLPHEDREEPRPPDRSAPADVTLTLPRPDGVDGLPQSVTFQRRQLHRMTPVVVSVVGAAPGAVVVLDGGRGHERFRVPVGEELAFDPFDDPEGRYVGNESYSVELMGDHDPESQEPVIVEVRAPPEVTVGLGAFGAPLGDYLGLRSTGTVGATAEGSVELSPQARRSVVSRRLHLTDAGQPVTGPVTVSIGAQATYHPPEGQPSVRIELVTADHSRLLTPVRAFQAVGRYIRLDFVDGAAQTPVDLTVVLEGDRATTVRWKLEARLDPLRSDTPRSAEVSMVGDDGG